MRVSFTHLDWVRMHFLYWVITNQLHITGGLYMHAEVVDLMLPWYVWIIMMIGTFIFTVVGTFLVARRIDK